MSKVLKILSIIIVMIGVICYSNNVYALNMDLGNNTSTNSTRDDEEINTSSNSNRNDNEEEKTANTNLSQSNNAHSSQEFTTRITVNTQELRISNVLSICLIAVGIVLILLAIAILIKLKR